MAEEKIKKPARKRSVRSAVKPIAKTARPKRKSATPKKPKRKAVKVVAADVASEPFIMPDIILPQPIHLTNTSAATGKPQKAKPPISFKQHVISIIAVGVVGILAMFTITSYYFITLTYIDTHAVQPSLLKPTVMLDKTFQTSAGRLTISYPDYWEVSSVAVDSVGFSDIWPDGVTRANTKVTVTSTDSASVVQWLKDNPPQYKNFQLTQLPDELTGRKGVMALADSDTAGNEILMFYFMHDVSVISIIMTYQADSNFATKNHTAFYSLVNTLEIE